MKQHAEVVLSDLGSPAEVAGKLKSLCGKHGFRYVRASDNFRTPRRRAGSTVSTNPIDFCPAVARNYGAKGALGRYVAFLDADLLPADGFMQRLMQIITKPEFAACINSVLIIPFRYTGRHTPDSELATKWTDKPDVPVYFPTSAVVMDRLYYLALGGQHEGFRGWGSEDHDLLFKSLLFSPLYNQDNEAFTEVLNDRRMKNRYQHKFLDYAVEIAREAAQKNVFLTHVWHQRDKDPAWWSKGAAKRNAKLFHQRCYRAVREGCADKPLENLSATDCVTVGRCELAQDRLFATLFRSVDHAPRGHATAAAETIYLFENPHCLQSTALAYARARNEHRPTIVANRLFGPYVLFLDRTLDELSPDVIFADRLAVDRSVLDPATCHIFVSGDRTIGTDTMKLLQEHFQLVRTVSIDDPASWPERSADGIAICSKIEQAWLAACLNIPLVLTERMQALPATIPVCPSDHLLAEHLARPAYASRVQVGEAMRKFLRDNSSILISAEERRRFRQIRNIRSTDFVYPFRYRRLTVRGHRLTLGFPDADLAMEGSRQWDTFE